MREWRIVPPVETWPGAVAFAQTWPGRLVLFAAFAGLMSLHAEGLWIAARWLWLWLTLAAVVVSLAGRYRHYALLACTGALLVIAGDWFEFRSVVSAIRREHLTGIRPEY